MTLDEFFATMESLPEMCEVCDGKGEVDVWIDTTPCEATGGLSALLTTIPCDHCAGTGWISKEPSSLEPDA